MLRRYGAVRSRLGGYMRTPRRSITRLCLPGGLMCAALLLSACQSPNPMSTLDVSGDHALRIYDLLVPIFWMALGVFVVVEGLLVYAVWRFRRRPNSGIPAQIHGNTRI